MSRDLVLKLGAIAWAVFAIDMFAHAVAGDWIIPAIVISTGVVWLAVRLTRRHSPAGVQTARR